MVDKSEHAKDPRVEFYKVWTEQDVTAVRCSSSFGVLLLSQ